jgi:hypothetical protein
MIAAGLPVGLAVARGANVSHPNRLPTIARW